MKEDKKALRKHLRAERRALSTAVCHATDRAIADLLCSADVFADAHCILLYAGVKNEVDLTAIAERALREGKEIAYPRVTGDGHMDFHVIKCLLSLKEDAYGIPAPRADAPIFVPNERTLMLVPALAYDKAGYRLGQGGGYYDRYLVDYPGITVGIIREDGFCEALPHEAHDKTVDMIITEKQIYRVK